MYQKKRMQSECCTKRQHGDWLNSLGRVELEKIVGKDFTQQSGNKIAKLPLKHST